MTPRPRETTDEAILEATSRAIARHGPARLTLAHVAADLDVSPATLVQRFGSKRGLMLALARQAGSATQAHFAAIRARHPAPLEALFAYAKCMSGMASSPAEFANHIAFLHTDLVDPEFHALALKQARVARGEVRQLLDEAVERGELVRCDTRRLARASLVVIGGALIAWAVDREGPPGKRLLEDLEMLLKPYARAARRTKKPRRKQRR